MNTNPSSIMASATPQVQGESSKEVLEAQAHLWNHIFSFINSFSLRTAVQLGLPDTMHSFGRPASLSELTAALSIPKARTEHFQRFMQLLVHHGFFGLEKKRNEDDEDVYSLTPFSHLLVKEKGRDNSPLLLVMLEETLLSPWASLADWLKSEEPSTAFELTHGVSVWQAFGMWPGFANKFKDGISSDSETINKVIVEDCREIFDGIGSLVMVELAAGTVSIIRAIAEAFPHIRCTLLDLPHMVADTVKSDKFDVVSGDMFDRIPPAQAVLFKWIFHCFSDEECVKILKRCKEAIPSKKNGGKVIIIDKVIDMNIEHQKLIETQLHFDVHMMVHTTGKQRTEPEWKKVFIDAGFKDYKIIPKLGLRSIIEVYY